MSIGESQPAAAAGTGSVRCRPELEGGGPGPQASLLLLAIGHAVTDTYGTSLLAPLFPEIAGRLGLSLAQVGSLPVMMGLTASLAQPALGWLSDRHPRWCFVALGPLLAAVCIGFVGQVHTYAQLALLLLAAGLGVGMFHPQGAALARRAGRGSGLAMSAFTVGGNIGFGFAPLLGACYTAWFGLERFYLAALPAVLFAARMLTVYDGPRTGGRGKSAPHPRGGRPQLAALAALTATVVVRTGVQMGMITFLPFLVRERFPSGEQAAMKSIAVSVFLLASALSGPLGGYLSDRFGRKRVMALSFALAPWPLALAFGQSGHAMLALLALGSALLMLPHPGNVVMAQEFLPRAAGIGASMITGLAAGLGQLLALPLGACAERFGLSATLTALCFLPLIGILLVIPIPERADPPRPTAS